MNLPKNDPHSLAPPAHQTIIEPRRGWLAINYRELWQHRELLYFFTWRDVKVRYKQTVLGFLWAFLQPFLKMVVFTAVFRGVMKADSEGFPYPIFLFAGLLPWQFFAESLSRSGMSVVSSAGIVNKVYFPRLIIPLASVGGCLVDFAISFTILLGLMVYYGVVPTLATLMILPLTALVIFTALGVGTLVSALNVAYRDFRYVIPFMLQIGMYATPVVYSVSAVPERWRWIMAINPMTGIIDGYRSAILGRPFAWASLAISLAVCLLLLVVGFYYFRRTEKLFADII